TTGFVYRVVSLWLNQTTNHIHFNVEPGVFVSNVPTSPTVPILGVSHAELGGSNVINTAFTVERQSAIKLFVESGATIPLSSGDLVFFSTSTFNTKGALLNVEDAATVPLGDGSLILDSVSVTRSNGSTIG
ncbi:MAG: hypothetical protein DRI24_21175, partial [Deltaproteobacteria bacterium]